MSGGDGCEDSGEDGPRLGDLSRTGRFFGGVDVSETSQGPTSGDLSRTGRTDRTDLTPTTAVPRRQLCGLKEEEQSRGPEQRCPEQSQSESLTPSDPTIMREATPGELWLGNEERERERGPRLELRTTEMIIIIIIFRDSCRGEGADIVAAAIWCIDWRRSKPPRPSPYFSLRRTRDDDDPNERRRRRAVPVTDDVRRPTNQ